MFQGQASMSYNLKNLEDVFCSPENLNRQESRFAFLCSVECCLQLIQIQSHNNNLSAAKWQLNIAYVILSRPLNMALLNTHTHTHTPRVLLSSCVSQIVWSFKTCCILSKQLLLRFQWMNIRYIILENYSHLQTTFCFWQHFSTKSWRRRRRIKHRCHFLNIQGTLAFVPKGQSVK